MKYDGVQISLQLYHVRVEIGSHSPETRSRLHSHVGNFRIGEVGDSFLCSKEWEFDF